MSWTPEAVSENLAEKIAQNLRRGGGVVLEITHGAKGWSALVSNKLVKDKRWNHSPEPEPSDVPADSIRLYLKGSNATAAEQAALTAWSTDAVKAISRYYNAPRARA